jgi:hypothetical protein
MLVSWHWIRKGAVQHEENMAVGGNRSDFGDDGWLQSDISPAIFTAASFSSTKSAKTHNAATDRFGNQQPQLTPGQSQQCSSQCCQR